MLDLVAGQGDGLGASIHARRPHMNDSSRSRCPQRQSFIRVNQSATSGLLGRFLSLGTTFRAYS